MKPLLVDATLGRLARWLRVRGYDAAHISVPDNLVVIRKARMEGRLVLTRSRELASKCGIDVLLIINDTLDGQMQEVMDALPLPAEPVRPRCVHCNIPLKPLSSEGARSRVPPYIWRSHTEFSECTQCHRVYWAGSHWQAVQYQPGEQPPQE